MPGRTGVGCERMAADRAEKVGRVSPDTFSVRCWSTVPERLAVTLDWLQQRVSQNGD